jgi:Xaa-Pro aminopeptidase
LLADSRYTTALDDLIASDVAPPDASRVAVDGSYDEALAAWLLAEASHWRVGFEASSVTVKRHAWLIERLSRDGTESSTPGTEVTLVPCDDLIESARAVKDEYEIGVLREAAGRLSNVARAVLGEAVHPGRSEHDLAAEIDHRLRCAGFERPAFETIVAAGPNSALPHAIPSDRLLAEGDLVLLDFGGVYNGYCVDLTRTVALGEPGAQYRKLYRAVAAAQDAAFAAVRAGVTADIVDAAARDVLARHELGDAFGHGTGHGLGLEIHEEPRVGRRRPEGPPPARLEAGMIVTIEPGAYVPGLGGVRIEDDVLVTSAGADRLTDVPRDSRLL